MVCYAKGCKNKTKFAEDVHEGNGWKIYGLNLCDEHQAWLDGVKYAKVK